METHDLIHAMADTAKHHDSRGDTHQATLAREVTGALKVLHAIELVAPALASIVPGLAPVLTVLKTVGPVVDTAAAALAARLTDPSKDFDI